MVAVMFSRNRASQLRGIDEWGLVGAAKPSHTSDHYMALLLLLRSNMATERLSCEPDEYLFVLPLGARASHQRSYHAAQPSREERAWLTPTVNGYFPTSLSRGEGGVPTQCSFLLLASFLSSYQW